MNPLKTGALTALLTLSFTTLAQTAADSQRELRLAQAIAIAIEQDPWFSASEHMQRADTLREASVTTRPSPSVSVGMLNLPVDTFSVHQEPMTQLRVGVTQAFARGDTVALTKQQHRLKATRHPVARQEHAAGVALTVTRHWLDNVEASQHQTLVEQEQAIVEQLIETTTSAYQSGMGRVRQQDVLDARLALAKLEEQRAQLMQRQEQAEAALLTLMGLTQATPDLAATLPDIVLPDMVLQQPPNARPLLAERLALHPSVQLLAVDYAVASQAVDIAEQKNAPQWAVNGSYGYRADSRSGDSRADFFSVGMSVDIPLFNQNANNSAVQAAVADSEAIETRRRALIRDLLIEVNAQRAALARLYDRQQRYQDDILPQSEAYAEATLDAYTAAQGEVETVLDARSAHLQAQIAALNIATDIARRRATLAYLTTTVARQEK